MNPDSSIWKNNQNYFTQNRLLNIFFHLLHLILCVCLPEKGALVGVIFGYYETRSLFTAVA
ncbi:UNVERIFIED_CONTAM: hypothetical protein NCL1_34481 [Trichonephila clavipes]